MDAPPGMIMKHARFSLRTLLWGILVVSLMLGAVVQYGRIESRYAIAKRKYDAIEAKCEARLCGYMEVCAESFMLYAAESDRWFRGNQAFANQLNRLTELEQVAQYHADIALFGDDGGLERARQKAEDIRRLRERFEKGEDLHLAEIPPAVDAAGPFTAQ
jgi:hypothetical protein